MAKTPQVEHLATGPKQQSTIIIALGRFGWDTIRKLLNQAAIRGKLCWAHQSSTSERKLQDLELIWLPDAGSSEKVFDTLDSESSEMMRDVHRQIVKLEKRDDLPAAMDRAVARLLDASERPHRDNFPLGLDIIVLANPTEGNFFSFIYDFPPLMKKLAMNKEMQESTQSASRLNFVQILDFDNYWDQNRPAAKLRDELVGSVDYWKTLQGKGKPHFGRIYLLDGRSAGIREPAMRSDEASVFLEFLIFSGQRAELQPLYQHPGTHDNFDPVASFGIRLIERHAALLGRLAAAYFSIRWLDYLAEGSSESSVADQCPSNLLALLDRFQPEKLKKILQTDALQKQLDGLLQAIEDGVRTAISNHQDANWVENIAILHRKKRATFRAETSTIAQQAVREINDNHFETLHDDIRAAISKDLHKEKTPSPLQQVITVLQDFSNTLKKESEQAEQSLADHTIDVEEDTKTVSLISNAHKRVWLFDEMKLKPERLKFWWLVFSVALVTLFTPWFFNLALDIPEPDKTSMLHSLYIWTRSTINPDQLNTYFMLSVIPFQFALYYWAGLYLHHTIEYRLARAKNKFINRKQGRFIAIIRRLTGRLGGYSNNNHIRMPEQRFIDDITNNMRLSIYSEVNREIEGILKLLERRKSELTWLRKQLEDFLNTQKVTLEATSYQSDFHTEREAIHFSLATEQDLVSLINHNPTTKAEFDTASVRIQPFGDWEQPYSDIFLTPLGFIERLLKSFELNTQADREQMTIKKIKEALKWLNDVPLAFHWQAQELPPTRLYCLYPYVWKQLSGLENDLNNVQVGTSLNIKEESMYFIRIQHGVPSGALTDTVKPRSY